MSDEQNWDTRETSLWLWNNEGTYRHLLRIAGTALFTSSMTEEIRQVVELMKIPEVDLSEVCFYSLAEEFIEEAERD